jgi:hypothetical protein
LIIRVDNDGSVSDGSRNLYKKDPTVRANRERIVRLADNKRAADKIPTKRRPQIQVAKSPGRALPSKRELKRRKRLTVLYLVANPHLGQPLRVDAEVRRVQEAIRGSLFRDNVTIEYRPAADLESLIDGLNDHRPQIVHFSGHGHDLGISTDTGKVAKPEAKTLSFDLLAAALSATDAPPAVVVLNSCKSSSAKKALTPTSQIVIAMRASVTDVAATVFATRFYAAIAAGQSIKAAFAQGKVAVAAASIGEVDVPELLHAPSIDPAKMKLT